VSSPSGRTALIASAADVLRELMARAVLFQDAVARAVGLNATDMQCANLLLLHGPMTPGELASLTGISAGGAVTGVVDRLERAGLARRSREPTDRRRVVVTAEADEVWRRVGPSYGRVAQRWQAFLDTLSDEQLAFADTLLRRASELNAEEIGRLRGTPVSTGARPGTEQ
jgi:DNA-binding MarR family transcriptional regulator